jgi:hypothetical protein
MTNFLEGGRQPIDQAAAMLGKAFPSQAPSIAAANQQARADFEKENAFPGAAGKAAELAGNVAVTAPIAALMPGAGSASLLARLGSGAATGAASGALNPVDPNDPYFWSKTGKNAAYGAAGGAAAPLVLGGAARAVSGATDPGLQALMNAGVRPTPGQILGGGANRLEEAAGSVPIMGDFIRSGRANAVQQFDRGAANQALAPIGQRLEASGMGRGAIGEMQGKIDDAYAAIKPQLGWPVGSPAATQFRSDLANLRGNVAASLPTGHVSQYDDAVNLMINNRLSSGGGITGESFHAAKSDIGKLAAGLAANPSGTEWDKRLAGALYQTQQIMRNAQNLENPIAGAAMANVDNAFAHSLRVNNAAGRPGADPGVFSPAQLQAATKSLDPSMRKNAFAAGDALMQGYAEAGKSILGNRVPDSGTPYRSLATILGGALAGHALSPATALGVAGGGAATAGMYSPLGRAALAHVMATRPAGAQPIAQGLRSFGPLASVMAPWVGASSEP